MKNTITYALLVTVVASAFAFSAPAGDDKYEKLPEIVKLVKPEFSEAMQRLESHGTVWVKVRVSADGTVTDATVTKSDVVAFNEVTLDAARKCKFSPAIYQGQPVPATVLIPFVFRPVSK